MEEDISQKSDYYYRTGFDDRCGRLYQLHKGKCSRK